MTRQPTSDPAALDQGFESGEKLYHAVESKQVREDRIIPATLRVPNTSVNREKYSRPEEVCTGTRILWGVLAFTVDDSTCSILNNVGDLYLFRVEHDPCPKLDRSNYAHCEIRVYREDQEDEPRKDVPNTVKDKYRHRIKIRARVIIAPRV